MPDYSTTLYDTAVFGVAVGENVLFQVAQGADATHTESFTNSPGAGALPADNSFVIDKIHVIIDSNMVAADIQNLPLASFLEIRISDRTVFKAPLANLMSKSAFGGHYSQAAAADEAVIGLVGDGYELKIPIEISGGVAFRVRVYQGTVLSAASRNLKVVLEGTLTMPG